MGYYSYKIPALILGVAIVLISIFLDVLNGIFGGLFVIAVAFRFPTKIAFSDKGLLIGKELFKWKDISSIESEPELIILKGKKDFSLYRGFIQWEKILNEFKRYGNSFDDYFYFKLKPFQTARLIMVLLLTLSLLSMLFGPIEITIVIFTAILMLLFAVLLATHAKIRKIRKEMSK